MKLISMTDFVLRETMKDPYTFKGRVERYAKFLIKPLTLGMFVPCDEDRNVLEQPIYTTNHSDECYCKECEEETKRCSDLQDQYQKAKEEVLFEGFEITKEGGNIIVRHNKTNVWLTYTKRCIEDLVRINPELTENALKQIGL